MILKCKMCGGDIELSADRTFGTCDSCGSIMTFPKVDDEQRANMFNRGNHFRRIGEFDKALAVYERIVQEDENDAEAHWCCALCRFGIEYVEDPNTFEYLPTCHRASFDSFLEDPDYLAAVEHSDGVTRRQYQKDAQKIAEVQRGILATSQNEEPFDVFICYKESENDGSRTRDSLYAQDIYYQLTEQGRRVFFSRITLEDKAGTEYEPYIFAALNSAKVMILVTTSAEHANAVWVKNEWSRFLSLMRKDRTKLLLPCYRDMDPYDLPEALSVLQSYDMSKIGFIQDLIRGVNKVLDGAKPKPQDKPQEKVVVQQQPGANAAPLLERAFMFLEDGDWAKADDFCEQVLNIEPKNAQAYVGKLMAELRVCKREALQDCAQPFDGSNNYRKALRFGDEKLKQELTGAVAFINNRNETARKEGVYRQASAAMKKNTEQGYREAAKLFGAIRGYKDAADLTDTCAEKAEAVRMEGVYGQAWILMKKATKDDLSRAAQMFQSIPGWKDADEKAAACRGRLDEIQAQREAERLEAEQKAEREAEENRIAEEKRRKKKKTIGLIVALLVIAAVPVFFVWAKVIHPKQQYNKAAALYEAGQYEQAKAIFEALDGYKDSAAQIKTCRTAILDRDYAAAVELFNAGRYKEALATFSTLDGYKDSDGYINACRDHVAVRNAVAVGWYHTVGLKADGTVMAVGDNVDGQCNVSGWQDIVAIAAGWSHTVGLKADGTVVAVGYNKFGQCDVSGCTDIVAIAAGGFHTVGLKADGTVVAVGSNGSGQCDVSGWTDIVAIAAGTYHTVGLKADGTVVATAYTGDYYYNKGQHNVSGWTDIVAIAASDVHTVGLKADGTVMAVGDNGYGRCDVSGWKDIMAIAAGDDHTVGLKADGTVVAVGSNAFGQCDVSGWKDIVAVAAGEYHTVGLKADGTVMAVGSNGSGQCDVSGWKGIRVPER